MVVLLTLSISTSGSFSHMRTAFPSATAGAVTFLHKLQ
jgi:hypothetical protein